MFVFGIAADGVFFVVAGGDDGVDGDNCVVVVVVLADSLPKLDFVVDLNVGVSIDVYDVLLNSLKRNVADDTRMQRMLTKMLLLLLKNSLLNSLLNSLTQLWLLLNSWVKQVANLNDLL